MMEIVQDKTIELTYYDCLDMFFMNPHWLNSV
jgi:hypothetical protein